MGTNKFFKISTGYLISLNIKKFWHFLQGTNLQQLQEAVITLAELMDLKGDPVGNVEGRVIESRLVTGKG